MSRFRRLLRSRGLWPHRPPRGGLLVALGVAIAVAVSSGGGCRKNAQEVPAPPEMPGPPGVPQPPEPPMPPPPPGAAPEAVRGTDYFEVPRAGERRIRADFDLALGRVEVAQAEPGFLFQAEVALVGQGMRPRFESRSDGEEAAVSLSLDGHDVSLRGVRRGEGNLWRLYLSHEVPLDLELQLGAAEADLNFSRVPLSRLDLHSGLAQTRLRFGAPNPIPMARLDVEAGLGNFTAHGLGNARFREFSFDGGGGRFVLDFRGEALVPGARAEVDVGLASLVVVVPGGHPVVLEAPSSFATHVRVPRAYAARGEGRWVSPEATRRPDAALHLTIDAGPGNVEVKEE